MAIKSPCHARGFRYDIKKPNHYQARRAVFSSNIHKMVTAREAYGQVIADDRLVDDHPNVITFIDYLDRRRDARRLGKSNP